MSAAPDRRSRAVGRPARLPYWIPFTLTVAVLVTLTGSFVLIVLPERFVLHAGLVESGVNFPSGPFPFAATRPTRAPLVASHRDLPPAPGPLESLWSHVLPLLRSERYEQALTQFETFLANHPDEASILREYAVTLQRAGRVDDAERVWRRLVRLGDTTARRELARILRDRRSWLEAIALYDEMLAIGSEDTTLLEERAQVMLWAARYDAAAVAFADLVRTSPHRHAYRLGRAQALYWGGHPEEALAAIGECRDSSPDCAHIEALRAELIAVTAQWTAPEQTLTVLDQARLAIAKGDLGLGATLYREALQRNDADPDLWLEWADVLQYRLEDLDLAREALAHRGSLRPLTADEYLRLARLQTWTGREGAARSTLEHLLETEPSSTAWAMLGELHRWRGDRRAAVAAYQAALDLAPHDTLALEGLAAARHQMETLAARRSVPDAGPEFLVFRDSDDFHRLDVGIRASFAWRGTGATVHAGYRRLEGLSLGGVPAVERGPFVRVDLARWLDFGRARAGVSVGLEELDAFGTEPTFGARLTLPSLHGAEVRAEFEHAPAFRQTITLESVLAPVSADRLAIDAFRGFGGWQAVASGQVTSLRGGGVDNWRVNAALTLRRTMNPLISAGLTSTYIAFADASPRPNGRRLYWDPAGFWSTAVLLEARAPESDRWSGYGRITPGLAVSSERDAPATSVVPQLGMEMGVGYRRGSLAFGGDLAYARGRGGGYRSLLATIQFTVRP